ncbi:MAG: hypothetical protein LBV17_05280 [Treponema sp.]|jgi:hypothetical protein|nr:hypothetical protein [Treponema sp.]
MIRGGGFEINRSDHTILTLSDKLIVGRNIGVPLTIYTYLEGGVGIFGNQTKKFFDKPLAFTGGFGGGGQFDTEDWGGLYLEVGYIGQQTSLDYPASGVLVQAGWRLFF